MTERRVEASAFLCIAAVALAEVRAEARRGVPCDNDASTVPSN